MEWQALPTRSEEYIRKRKHLAIGGRLWARGLLGLGWSRLGRATTVAEAVRRPARRIAPPTADAWRQFPDRGGLERPVSGSVGDLWLCRAVASDPARLEITLTACTAWLGALPELSPAAC